MAAAAESAVGVQAGRTAGGWGLRPLQTGEPGRELRGVSVSSTWRHRITATGGRTPPRGHPVYGSLPATDNESSVPLAGPSGLGAWPVSPHPSLSTQLEWEKTWSGQSRQQILPALAYSQPRPCRSPRSLYSDTQWTHYTAGDAEQPETTVELEHTHKAYSSSSSRTRIY
jgi:hypothetical protein